jgi:transposase
LAARIAEGSLIARKPYPSDLTDGQWEVVKTLLPQAEAEELARDSLDFRELVNAILYAEMSGCRWAMLPNEFPPWGTVHSYYRRWRNDGTWDEIRAVVGSRTGGLPLDPEPLQAEDASQLSPTRRLRIAKMCPYLGSRSDRMTRRAYASTQNVCRSGPESYRRVSVDKQDQSCLGEDHVRCEHYQARVARDAEQSAVAAAASLAGEAPPET